MTKDQLEKINEDLRCRLRKAQQELDSAKNTIDQLARDKDRAMALRFDDLFKHNDDLKDIIYALITQQNPSLEELKIRRSGTNVG